MHEEEGDRRADEDDGQVALFSGQGGGAVAVLAFVPEELPSLLKYLSIVKTSTVLDNISRNNSS